MGADAAVHHQRQRWLAWIEQYRRVVAATQDAPWPGQILHYHRIAEIRAVNLELRQLVLNAIE